MSVGASRYSPMWLSRPGPPARAYSSKKMTWRATLAPPPPCSTGQPSPIQLALPLDAQLDLLVLAPGTAGADERGELAGEVVGEPLPHLVAEGLVVHASQAP